MRKMTKVTDKLRCNRFWRSVLMLFKSNPERRGWVAPARTIDAFENTVSVFETSSAALKSVLAVSARMGKLPALELRTS